jgi:hypothetical protein
VKVQVLSSTLDNQTKIVYDCLISGVSSAVERYPSKLDVVGSIPILRSEPSGSYSPIAQRQSRELLTLRFLVRIEVGELKGLEMSDSFILVLSGIPSSSVRDCPL